MGKDGMCFVSVPTLQEMFDTPSLTPAQELIALFCFHRFLGKLCREHSLLAGMLPDCAPALLSIREAGAC